MSSATYNKPLVTDGTGVAPLTAPDSGVLAFGAVTGTSAATANTVVTATDNRGLLEVINASDADVVLTCNGVSTNLIVKAGTARMYDLQSALRRIDAGSAIGVYRRSTALTTNEVIVQLI